MVPTVSDRSLDSIAKELHRQLEMSLEGGLAGVGIGAQGDGPEFVVYVLKSAKVKAGVVPTTFEGTPVRVVRIGPIRF